MIRVTILTSQRTSRGNVLAEQDFSSDTDAREFINQWLKQDKAIDWNVDIVE